MTDNKVYFFKRVWFCDGTEMMFRIGLVANGFLVVRREGEKAFDWLRLEDIKAVNGAVELEYWKLMPGPWEDRELGKLKDAMRPGEDCVS